MSSSPQPSMQKRLEVTIRLLREKDLPVADRIMRLAFGTFLGLPDPLEFMGDADYVRTRWLADPFGALGAEFGGELVGTNFATRWGSVGFLAMNALLLIMIAYPLMHIGVAGSPGGRTDVLGVILGAAVVYGPLVASASGIVLGVLAGCYFGRHKLAVSATV